MKNAIVTETPGTTNPGGRRRPKLKAGSTYPTVSLVSTKASPLHRLAWIFGLKRGSNLAWRRSESFANWSSD